MTFSQQFEKYLADFRQRLKRLTVARGLAAMAVAALAITLLAVTLAIRNGFPADLMITSRLILAVCIAGLAYYFVVVLRRRIDTGAAPEIEQRTPEFDGRVEAYLDTDDVTNPMRELLAEETLGIASAHPAKQQIPQREFRFAWSVALSRTNDRVEISLLRFWDCARLYIGSPNPAKLR